MSDAVGEYGSALADLEVAYKNGVRAFAEWFAKEWVMSREDWVKAFNEPPPSDDWFEGHNKGVESATMALDAFFGDYHP